MEVGDAVREAEEICDMIDNDVPEEAWNTAYDFFDDVREKCQSIVETIEQRGTVSTKQASALRNWKRAVAKWIPDD